MTKWDSLVAKIELPFHHKIYIHHYIHIEINQILAYCGYLIFVEFKWLLLHEDRSQKLLVRKYKSPGCNQCSIRPPTLEVWTSGETWLAGMYLITAEEKKNPDLIIFSLAFKI